jgi:hypothetical protein
MESSQLEIFKLLRFTILRQVSSIPDPAVRKLRNATGGGNLDSSSARVQDFRQWLELIFTDGGIFPLFIRFLNQPGVKCA